MSDSYLPGISTAHAPRLHSDFADHSTGAVVLAHSLRDCGTRKKLAVLVTLDSLLRETVKQLEARRTISSPVTPPR